MNGEGEKTMEEQTTDGQYIALFATCDCGNQLKLVPIVDETGSDEWTWIVSDMVLKCGRCSRYIHLSGLHVIEMNNNAFSLPINRKEDDK